ncbi:MAG: zinc metalloprotease HtpX [Armatimonadia bacterium]
MATEEMTAERTRAFYKFKEAEQHAAKHHYEQAMNSARDALEVDPTFVEVRFWIADLHLRMDSPRKASLEYQEIIHQNRDNQQAWEKLREIDPASAERLERLHDIAPDPFVVQRTSENAVSEDLDDLGGLADEFVSEEEEILPQHEPAEFDSLEDLSGTDAIKTELQEGVGAIVGVTTAAPEPQPSGPPDWLYEEDLKYRDKMDHNPVFAKLLPNVIEFWKDSDSWETAISGSVHLDEHRHPEIVQVCQEAADALGVPHWTMYVCPERRMVCCITRGDPPTISLTTGVMNTLSHAEQLFAIGRFSAMVAAGHVPYLQMTMMALERSPRSITDVEIDMLELLKHHHGGWDAGVHREDRIKLGALAHAWQQRAELSADRGGLICCRDLEAALNGIAKTTAHDATAASTLTWKALAEKHKGEDPGALAAIPPKEDPSRHEGYAVYRIQMLRWWAKTPAGQAYLTG